MKKIILFLLFSGLIAGIGCNKDESIDCTDVTNPDCSNYNPCHDQKSTSADFQTAGVLVSNTSLTITVEEDTFFLGTSVLFTAIQEDAISYEWKIGDDDRVFTEQEFSLSFNPSDSISLFNRPFPIQLIVTRTPNTTCFPTDDGIDTLTKYIYFVSRHEVSHKNFVGEWVGSMEHTPDDIYEMEMYEEADVFSQPWELSYYELVIKNLDNEGNSDCLYEQSSGNLLYNSFYIGSSYIQNLAACQRVPLVNPAGIFGRIDEKGKLRIEWWQWVDTDNKSVQRVFNGYRK